MRVKLIVIFLCLFLNNCGGNWVSKTKSPAALEKDTLSCQHQAKTQYPPKMHFVRATSYDSVATSYGSNGVNIRPTEEVNIQERDSNEDARDQAFKKCMINHGLHLE
jgi:hypothetical protein